MADEFAITKAAEDATKELIIAAFNELKNAAAQDKKEETKVFFPKGIELISITVSVFNKITVEVKVAGAACCKGNEEGFTFEAAQGVTEE